jgi:membrane-bound lytic murein transglycosylase D
VLQRFGEDNYHIPPQMIQRVRYHLDNYRGELNPVVKRFLARRDYYFAIISPILAEAKLPPELGYVALLESGFDTTALSPAGARGLWQLMPQTAMRYGLVVNDSIDERTNARKASRAAAEYFTDLIALFGGKSSIMLSLAAYNAGEGRIGAALRKIDDPLNNRDFWHLYRMGYLAQETNEYIPRIIALIVLAEHGAHNGFATGAFTPSQPSRTIAAEDSFLRIDY